jgi:hypothetical protein
MKYIIYLFYNYYSKSPNTASIAYENALLATSFLLFLNLFAIINFFNLNYLFPNLAGKSRGSLYLILASFYFLPIFLILFIFYRKSIVISATYEQSKVKIHGWLLLMYMIFSVVMLVFAINFETPRCP